MSRSLSPIGLLLVVLICVVLCGVAGAQSSMSVTEFGVGTAVEDRVLKGKSDSFAEGTTVWFWTNVVGGQEAEKIRHVWIRAGKETPIALYVGGPRWRTYSSKQLHPGSVGSWTVEARDEDGRVLAKQEFRCTPPDPSADATSDDGKKKPAAEE